MLKTLRRNNPQGSSELSERTEDVSSNAFLTFLPKILTILYTNLS